MQLAPVLHNTYDKLQLCFLWQVGKAHRCGRIKKLLLVVQTTGRNIKLWLLLITDIFDDLLQRSHWGDIYRLSFTCDHTVTLSNRSQA